MKLSDSTSLTTTALIPGLLVDSARFGDVSVVRRRIPDKLRARQELHKTVEIERADVLAFDGSVEKQLLLELYSLAGDPLARIFPPSKFALLPENGDFFWILGQDKNEGLIDIGCSWPPRYEGIYQFSFDGIRNSHIRRDSIGSLDMKARHALTTSTGSLLVAHRKDKKCFVTRIDPGGDVAEFEVPPWLNEGLAAFDDGELLSVGLYYGQPVRENCRRRAILYRRDGEVLYDFETGLDVIPRIIAASAKDDIFIVQTALGSAPGKCRWDTRKISDPESPTAWIDEAPAASQLLSSDDRHFFGALFSSGEMAILDSSGHLIARLPSEGPQQFYSSRVRWDGDRFEFRRPGQSVYLAPRK